MGTDIAAAVMLLAIAVAVVAVLTTVLTDRRGSIAVRTDDPARPAPSDQRPVRLRSDADACSARSRAHEFFKDKRCAICGVAIAESPRVHHFAALRGRDGITIEWSEMPIDRLVAALKTHAAVCWNCHVAEEFRRQYPDRVTDRPEHVESLR